MELYRNTYAEINLKNIETNIRKIVEKFYNYKYYFGVIKADSYGHGDTNTANSMIKRWMQLSSCCNFRRSIRTKKSYKRHSYIMSWSYTKTIYKRMY